jgi:hypothetical protein
MPFRETNPPKTEARPSIAGVPDGGIRAPKRAQNGARMGPVLSPIWALKRAPVGPHLASQVPDPGAQENGRNAA